VQGEIASGGSNPIMATEGWDAASGLGSIKAKTFYSLITGATPVQPPTTQPPTTNPPTGTTPSPTTQPPTLPPGLEQTIIGAINAEFAALEARNPILARAVLVPLNAIVDQVIAAVFAQYGNPAMARIPPGLLGGVLGGLLPVYGYQPPAQVYVDPTTGQPVAVPTVPVYPTYPVWGGGFGGGWGGHPHPPGRRVAAPNFDWGKIDWSGDINALVPIILNILQAIQASK
jgi:hypothetical protein